MGVVEARAGRGGTAGCRGGRGNVGSATHRVRRVDRLASRGRDSAFFPPLSVFLRLRAVAEGEGSLR